MLRHRYLCDRARARVLVWRAIVNAPAEHDLTLSDLVLAIRGEIGESRIRTALAELCYAGRVDARRIRRKYKVGCVATTVYVPRGMTP
jgi:hypothetical protein